MDTKHDLHMQAWNKYQGLRNRGTQV